MKPIHIMLQEIQDEQLSQRKLIENIIEIQTIKNTIQPPTNTPKSPEEFKAGLVSMINEGFKEAGIETPIVDNTLVQDVAPIVEENTTPQDI